MSDSAKTIELRQVKCLVTMRTRPLAKRIRQLELKVAELTRFAARQRHINQAVKVVGFVCAALILNGCAVNEPAPAAIALPKRQALAASVPAAGMTTNRVQLKLYNSWLARGWRVEESQDLRTWRPVAAFTNTAPKSAHWLTNTITSTNAVAFFRVRTERF